LLFRPALTNRERRLDPYPIFICYRRQDSADAAGRLYDRLTQHFGKESIFKDVDSIPLGVDFRAHLRDKVENCSALLAIIGRSWVSAASASGERALDDLNDFVRVEIECALKHDVLVIPVLIHNANLPEAVQLPDSMSELVFRQCLSVRPDPDFHGDVNRLISGLEHHRAQEAARKTAAARRKEQERLEKQERQEKAARLHAQEQLRQQQEAQKAQERNLNEARKRAQQQPAGNEQPAANTRQRPALNQQPAPNTGQQPAGNEGSLVPGRDGGEAAAWRKACNVNTYKAYLEYAKAFPTGPYYSLAAERYRRLKPFWASDQLESE
jgi:hypothetical protein